MDRYVAFLRGMNLGSRRLKNEELRSHIEELGFQRVVTFRASGNLILSAARGRPDAIATRIEKGLNRALGYQVPVVLRSGAEVCEIAARLPFDRDLIAASSGKLQVTLLRETPPARARKQVLGMATDADRLAISARELYWLPSGGVLDSALDIKAIAALLGEATMRTKGTIDQLVAKHFIEGTPSCWLKRQSCGRRRAGPDRRDGL